jgi:hypothetical protein
LSACRDKKAIENQETASIRALYVATYEEIIQRLWGIMPDHEKEIVQQEIREKQYYWVVN